VTGGPVRSLAVDEAPPAKELEDVVTGLEDLALEGLPAPDEVSYAFFLFGRDVDEDEAVVAEVASDLDGVAPIGLAMLARSAWNEGGSGELARDARLEEHSLKNVAGTGCLV